VGAAAVSVLTSGAGRAIDHVVVAVADLDREARQLEALGFTLTPRAQHPWGTANRLAQFPNRTFIELLEIDRPHLLFEHAAGETPPRFSFGAFNRDFLARAEGMSMLVLASRDAAADTARFRDAGLPTFAPFEFERQARLPDDSTVRVAFSLAFTSLAGAPRAGLFTCHNHTPEAFWKPDYQVHGNGAEGIFEVILVAADPAATAPSLAAFSGGTVAAAGDGAVVTCGPQRLRVLTPAAYRTRLDLAPPDLAEGPRFAGLVITAPGAARRAVPADQAGGVALVFEPGKSA
jgi:hypothetical protein